MTCYNFLGPWPLQTKIFLIRKGGDEKRCAGGRAWAVGLDWQPRLLQDDNDNGDNDSNDDDGAWIVGLVFFYFFFSTFTKLAIMGGYFPKPATFRALSFFCDHFILMFELLEIPRDIFWTMIFFQFSFFLSFFFCNNDESFAYAYDLSPSSSRPRIGLRCFLRGPAKRIVFFLFASRSKVLFYSLIYF